jgi:DNA-binding GntR family transcriptional regulator
MQLHIMTKSDAIYTEVKKRILDGTLKPGTRLVIQQLAGQYGVSDIPVREALKELTAEGFVETIPHLGSRVASMSLKGIEEMLVMRECLEPFAAELAAENADEKTIERLEKYCDDMKKAFDTGDTAKYRDLNRAFHKLFIDASGNQLMAKTILELMDSEKRMRMIFQLFPEILELSNNEHRQMVHYLRERDSKTLSKIVYDHKKRVFDKLRRYLQKHLEE